MATNKVITVTVIPTRTGDTVASYNAYSSVDGLLGSLSVAEAAAGKTFSLSDSNHNITVKTVWTTAGESTTNVSNIVVVDLSATDILFQDDFAGATIDSMWTVSNSEPTEMSITQNEKLIFTDLVGNVTSAGGAHKVDNNTPSTYGSITRCIQMDMEVADMATTRTKFGVHDGTIDNRIYFDRYATGSRAALIIRLNNVTEYNIDSGIDLNGNTFKIEIVNSTIKFFYYNSGWVQLGTTQTFDFTGVSMNTWIEGAMLPDSIIGSFGAVDNYYETDATYTTQTPS